MLFVFRADASLVIGSGHIMRCLTLAKFLREIGHDCEFVCRDHSGNLESLIENEGFAVHLLTSKRIQNERDKENSNENFHDWLGVTWKVDAEQTRHCLGDRFVDWLVVDNYAIDHRWHSYLRKSVKRIMVIDDLANRCFDCDVILDQNLGRQHDHYNDLIPQECIRLIGPQYALLRPEFAELRESSLARRISPRIHRILISLGGVDIDNVTADVIDALDFSELPSFIELDIVMGSTAPHIDKIKERITNLRFTATISVNVRNMAERMLLADFAIGAAGSSTWERCCLGLPSIALVLAENQKVVSEILREKGIVMQVIELDKLTQLTECFNNITPNKLFLCSQRAKSITDGEGTKIVARVLTKECLI